MKKKAKIKKYVHLLILIANNTVVFKPSELISDKLHIEGFSSKKKVNARANHLLPGIPSETFEHGDLKVMRQYLKTIEVK